MKWRVLAGVLSNNEKKRAISVSLKPGIFLSLYIVDDTDAAQHDAHLRNVDDVRVILKHVREEM
ncbi:hypothetical protein D3C81_1012840 [compost metagenome]